MKRTQAKAGALRSYQSDIAANSLTWQRLRDGLRPLGSVGVATRSKRREFFADKKEKVDGGLPPMGLRLLEKVGACLLTGACE
jgi:hypothetical protein